MLTYKFNDIEDSFQCSTENLIDFESAKKQIALFLLKEECMTVKDIFEIAPAIYSFCNAKYKDNNNSITIEYHLHSKSYNEDNNYIRAWTYGNNIGINLNSEDLLNSKFPLYSRVSFLNDLFHEHRHINDYYDKNIKKSIGEKDPNPTLDPNCYDLFEKFKDKIKSKNLDNPDFDSKTLDNQIQAFLIAKYYLADNELRARTTATDNLKEIYAYLKENMESLKTDTDTVELVEYHIDNIENQNLHYLNYCKDNNVDQLDQLNPLIFSQFKDFQDELWKTAASPRLRPKLDIFDSMSRFNCNFYNKQLLEDYDLKIASLSINYSEERAREVFNEVTELLNEDSDEHYHISEPQLLYNLVHFTSFTPSMEDFKTIASAFRNSQLPDLESFMESFTDYQTDELLECYAKANPNYMDYYQRYGYNSSFIPLNKSEINHFLDLLEKESKALEESEIEEEKLENSSPEENYGNYYYDKNYYQNEDQSSDSFDQTSSNYGDYDDYGNHYGFGQD